jgi:hypothetical protein
MNGQLNALADLCPGKEPSLPIRWEAGRAPEPVWTTWREEKSCPYQDSNSEPSTNQPIASCYNCAILAHQHREVESKIMKDTES